MKLNKLGGWCFILFGVINVLHEIHLRAEGIRQPGIGYAFITSLLFTAGAVLLWRKNISHKS